MMPPLLILDHAFHRKTRSFDFLFSILGSAFDTTIEYVEPTSPDIERLQSFEQAYVVICQLDFLAPLFLNLGRRVVIVQMFDGSGGLPDTYWKYNRQATYLNFSLAMHLRALRAGCRSMLVKYFVDHERYKAVEDFSTRRLFFWQRLPSSRINTSLVGHLVGSMVDSVHLHLPADEEGQSDQAANAFPCEVTTSEWFESRDDFDRILDACNIFVAPRLAEGIGQVMLEAMARGMVVLAYDLPTHNEYICNWYNGILFDLSSGPVQVEDWAIRGRRMGERARMTVKRGHADWLRQAAAIPSFVADTLPAAVPPGRFFRDVALKTISAYNEGHDTYVKSLDCPLAVEASGGWRETIVPTQVQEASSANTIKNATFICGADARAIKLQSGWSAPEGGHVWAIARSARLRIDMSSANFGPFEIFVEARSLTIKSVTIRIDDEAPVQITFAPLFNRYRIPGSVTLRSNSLSVEFTVETLDEIEADPRSFAFALRSVHLERITP